MILCFRCIIVWCYFGHISEAADDIFRQISRHVDPLDSPYFETTLKNDVLPSLKDATDELKKKDPSLVNFTETDPRDTTDRSRDYDLKETDLKKGLKDSYYNDYEEYNTAANAYVDPSLVNFTETNPRDTTVRSRDYDLKETDLKKGLKNENDTTGAGPKNDTIEKGAENDTDLTKENLSDKEVQDFRTTTVANDNSDYYDVFEQPTKNNTNNEDKLRASSIEKIEDDPTGDTPSVEYSDSEIDESYENVLSAVDEPSGDKNGLESGESNETDDAEDEPFVENGDQEDKEYVTVFEYDTTEQFNNSFTTEHSIEAKKIGDSCETDWDCNKEKKHICLSTKKCGQYSRKNTGKCFHHSHCSKNKSCVRGRCQLFARSCRKKSHCLPKHYCETKRRCRGKKCVGKCKMLKSVGEKCTDSGECDENSVCSVSAANNGGRRQQQRFRSQRRSLNRLKSQALSFQPGRKNSRRPGPKYCLEISKTLGEKCTPNKTECVGHLVCKVPARRQTGRQGGRRTNRGNRQGIRGGRNRGRQGGGPIRAKKTRFKRQEQSPQRRRRPGIQQGQRLRQRRQKQQGRRHIVKQKSYTCQEPDINSIDCEVNEECPCGQFCHKIRKVCLTATCRNHFDCIRLMGRGFICLNNKMCSVRPKVLWEQVCRLESSFGKAPENLCRRF